MATFRSCKVLLRGLPSVKVRSLTFGQSAVTSTAIQTRREIFLTVGG